MGLDMYLTKKHFITNPDEVQVTGLEDGIELGKITYIIEEAGYWRKANAIHNWFVKNVQHGADDCGTYYVSEGHLKALLSSVIEVLGDHTKAKDILPTGGGFFFGSTGYDEWYFQGLATTKEILEKALSDKSDAEFEYHSSW